MQEIKTIEDWQKLLKISKDKPVLIFKHSSTCPISAGVHKKMDKAEKESSFKVPTRVIVVQNSKDISNQIAKDLNIKHESPQILIMKDGELIFDQDHGAINLEEIIQHLN